MPLLHLAHGRALAWGEGSTLVMGIVNVTPDSFSDGGRCLDPELAVRHALRMATEGAHMVDIGGESTRPGSESVPLDEERRRVLPVVRELHARRPDILLSVDTSKPELAAEALAAGAHMINDVTGGRDPQMRRVVSAAQAGFCLMHMQGTPATMQQAPSYANAVADVQQYLSEQLASLEAEGLKRGHIMLDPGIGFGKRLEDNLELIAHAAATRRALGCPVLIGLSRKRMIGDLTGIADPAARDLPSVMAGIAAAACGAAMLRVHDVAGTVAALRVADPILGRRPVM